MDKIGDGMTCGLSMYSFVSAQFKFLLQKQYDVNLSQC